MFVCVICSALNLLVSIPNERTSAGNSSQYSSWFLGISAAFPFNLSVIPNKFELQDTRVFNIERF